METNCIGFNHYTISVHDVDISIKYYRDILGLKTIKRPSFDFRGAWFDVGNQVQLHLIEDVEIQIIPSGSRSLHFAFHVENVRTFHDNLLNKGIEIVHNIKARPDGVLQFYITDPDGYFIEITEYPPLTE